MKKSRLNLLAVSMVALSAVGLMAGDPAPQKSNPTVRVIFMRKKGVKQSAGKMKSGVYYIRTHSEKAGVKEYKLDSFGQGLDLNIDPCTNLKVLYGQSGGVGRSPKRGPEKLITLAECKNNAPKGKNTYVILLGETSKEFGFNPLKAGPADIGDKYYEDSTKKLWANVDPKYKKFGRVVNLFKDYDALKKNRDSRGIEVYENNHNDLKCTPTKK